MISFWYHGGTRGELLEALVEDFTPSFTLGEVTKERVTEGKYEAFTPQFSQKSSNGSGKLLSETCLK